MVTMTDRAFSMELFKASKSTVTALREEIAAAVAAGSLCTFDEVVTVMLKVEAKLLDKIQSLS